MAQQLFSSFIEKNLQGLTREQIVDAVTAEIARLEKDTSKGGYGAPPELDPKTRLHVSQLKNLLALLTGAATTKVPMNEIAEVRWAIGRLVERGQIPADTLSKPRP